MYDATYQSDEQLDRLNGRIAKVAADYTRSRMQRTLWLQAGDVRRARALSKRLHMLNSELAFLASHLKQWDYAPQNTQQLN
jgi:hypothetical protein